MHKDILKSGQNIFICLLKTMNDYFFFLLVPDYNHSILYISLF